MAATMLAATAARADQIFVSSSAPIDEDPSRGRKPSTGKASRENGELAIGDILFSGSLIAGGVYNDNLYSSRFNKTSDFGYNLSPSFTLHRDVGLHSTTLSGSMNNQFYVRNSDGNVNSGGLSLSHVYEVERDLIVYLQGHVGRNVNQTPIQTVNSAFQFKPAYYNEEYFSGSVEKSFDRISVGVGASVLGQQYEDFSDTTGRRYYTKDYNGTNKMVTARVGYAITPVIQAFVQPSYNWQNFDNRLYDSSGYSLTAGLRSDRIGLFRGEVYGGYQEQTFDNLNVTSKGPTFGGSISYFPTRDWTFSASLSQSYGLTQGVAYQGGTGRSTSGSLSANYIVSRTLNASGSVFYGRASYSRSNLEQASLGAGLQVNYMFTAHLGMNAGYSFTRVNYSQGQGGYDRNMITLGANARF
jgi:hypothetical protein